MVSRVLWKVMSSFEKDPKMSYAWWFIIFTFNTICEMCQHVIHSHTLKKKKSSPVSPCHSLHSVIYTVRTLFFSSGLDWSEDSEEDEEEDERVPRCQYAWTLRDKWSDVHLEWVAFGNQLTLCWGFVLGTDNLTLKAIWPFFTEINHIDIISCLWQMYINNDITFRSL